MMEWQPIETAPKDGSSVLVFDYYETDGCALPDGRLRQTGNDGLGWVVARFTENHGWHVSASVIGDLYVKLRNPKFWMPIPDNLRYLANNWLSIKGLVCDGND